MRASGPMHERAAVSGRSSSFVERALVRALLLRPGVVRARLAELRRSGVVRVVPNEWQISLGVLRMLHRLAFRSETVGQSRTHPIRATSRARVWALRPLRSPFLLRARAIAPLDLSGLLSSTDRIVCHLIGAHHDGNQFAYDLEMLAATPHELGRVLERARAIVAGADPESEFFRDLCVYDGYHESLVAACERALRGDYGLSSEDAASPDISFAAYLRWCAAQPATFEETLSLAARGHFHPMLGRRDVG